MKKQILKSLIIKLSKENCLITQFTSFVAVEKRVCIVNSWLFHLYLHIKKITLALTVTDNIHIHGLWRAGRREAGRTMKPEPHIHKGLIIISLNESHMLCFWCYKLLLSYMYIYEIHYNFTTFGHFSPFINARPSKNRKGLSFPHPLRGLFFFVSLRGKDHRRHLPQPPHPAQERGKPLNWA